MTAAVPAAEGQHLSFFDASAHPDYPMEYSIECVGHLAYPGCVHPDPRMTYRYIYLLLACGQ